MSKPKIEISQNNLNWLKDNMESTDYSVEQVIERLIDRYKKAVSTPPDPPIVGPDPHPGPYKYGPHSLRGGRLNPPLPDMTYVNIVAAQVNGRPVRNNWNTLRKEVFSAAGSVEAVRKLPFRIAIHKGDLGSDYVYIRKLDISLRKRDAICACRDAVYAALMNDIELEIQFFSRKSNKTERIVVGDY